MFDIIGKFKSLLPCEWEPTKEQVNILNDLVSYAKERDYNIETDIEAILIESVNQKLGLNSFSYRKILDEAYMGKIKLNYIQKTKIKSLLDYSNYEAYLKFLYDNGIYTDRLANAFVPVSKETSLCALKDIIRTDKRYTDVLASVFSRYCFNLFPKDCTYSFFSEKDNSKEDFFEFVNDKFPDLGDRTNALSIIDVPPKLFSKGYKEGCNIVLNAIKNAYKTLNNHCVMAIVIPPILVNSVDYQWRLYADTILFAEKHLKEEIDKTYFRWEKIALQTTQYIPQTVSQYSDFKYAFQGFVFKDCFVIENIDATYSLLLIFEKNKRDERSINCPACRTKKIQGNSYPLLNVRSWECENSLCPDRSKYNRGKRYAFMSLFRQKEMLNDDNVIPDASISKWRLDCRRNASKEEILEMLIRHYSCFGDGISIISQECFPDTMYGRIIKKEDFVPTEIDLLSLFKQSSYFKRYIQHNDRLSVNFTEWSKEGTSVFNGDALDVLRSLKDDMFTGVVTSPPYYNAKSYSQWNNIYCYLYDMYNINSEVFRTLKNGGIYLFNIFDYFDNENNVALSAMGNKRMILGAYMIDMFERIGFTICGNIIWNKGEIQGNRSFNQGNMTPYYQAPLNCWEHIIILSKGIPDKKFSELYSSIKYIKPVMKIVRGKNIVGHEAPYPFEIPELLLQYLSETDLVLDPFLGSGTTCIVANKYGVKSIGIEKNNRYFNLCKSNIISLKMEV